MAREYNKYIYTIIKYVPGPAFERFRNDFFKKSGVLSGVISADKRLMMIDRKSINPAIVPDNLKPKQPAYLKGIFPNWPNLTHKEMLFFTNILASKPDGKDGFKFHKKLEK